MVASAKPFVPNSDDAAGRTGGPPLPSERPFALGTRENRMAGTARAAEVGSAGRQPARSVVRAQAGEDAQSLSTAPTGPAGGFVPQRSDGAVGLMSGRGLY